MRRMIGLAVLTALIPSMSEAQTNCADRARITERLQTKYGETFAGGGLRDAKSIVEVWFSEAQGTWTILVTLPDGRACIMASGTNWLEALPSQQAAGIPG